MGVGSTTVGSILMDSTGVRVAALSGEVLLDCGRDATAAHVVAALLRLFGATARVQRARHRGETTRIDVIVPARAA